MTCVWQHCDWMPLWTGEGEAEVDKNGIVGHHGSSGEGRVAEQNVQPNGF